MAWTALLFYYGQAFVLKVCEKKALQLQEFSEMFVYM